MHPLINKLHILFVSYL